MNWKLLCGFCGLAVEDCECYGKIQRAAALALLLFVAGCATEPKPFKFGHEVNPPFGCDILRERGGEC